MDRVSLLKLPRPERDRILAERAEVMAPEYENDWDWKEFLGGEFTNTLEWDSCICCMV